MKSHSSPSPEMNHDEILAQQREKLQIETAVQVFLLELVSHSVRPLRLLELADALGFEFRDTSPGLGNRPKDIARQACGSLLVVNSDETVRIADEAVVKALTGGEDSSTAVRLSGFPAQSVAQVHRKLTVFCLEYLRTGKFEEFKSEHRSFGGGHNRCSRCGEFTCDCWYLHFDLEAATFQHPFLDYAVRNWFHHAGRYDFEDADLFGRIESLMDGDNSYLLAWTSVTGFYRPTKTDCQVPSALHLAARAGLTQYCRLLLAKGVAVDVLDDGDATPLWYAAFGGHTSTFLFLEHKGANLNQENSRGSTPLHEASRRNYYEIVGFLLRRGVDLLTPKSKENRLGELCGGEISTIGETAVEYVCKSGHTESIVEMIPFADAATLGQMLCECALFGYYEAVRVLLSQSSVSPDAECHGATALFHAAKRMSVHCVKLLLEKGADINKESKFLFRNRRVGPGPSVLQAMKPLHIVIREWNKDNNEACSAIFDLFRTYGINLEDHDQSGKTYLHYTLNDDFWKGQLLYELPMKRIVEAGADVSALYKGNSFLTCVMQAHRNIEIIEFLLEHGASLRDLSSSGGTVWHVLLGRGYGAVGPDTLDDIAKYLMEHGAGDLRHCKDINGRTALEFAADNSLCSFELFKMMLHACPDDAARKNCYRLLERQSEDFDRRLKELEAVSAGGKQQVRETLYKPVKSLFGLRKRQIRAAIDAGYPLDEVDSRGRNVLFHYVSESLRFEPENKIPDWLVSKGLNPKKVDNFGNTLLHEAAQAFTATKPCNVNFVEQIIGYGISPNTRNFQGRTALHKFFGEHVRPFFPGPLWKPSSKPFLEVLKSHCDELDIDAIDEQGLTALHEASKRSEFAAHQLLLAGADPYLRTGAGDTVLHLAAREQKANIVGLFIERTGSILLNEVNKSNETPLHLSCRSGHLESAYYLLRAGAKVDVKNLENRNLLHACAESITRQTIWTYPFFAKQPESSHPGADTHHADETGSTSYGGRDTTGIVSAGTHVGVLVKLLVKAGVDPYAEDITGLTPLSIAAQNSNNSAEAIRYLEDALKSRHCGDTNEIKEGNGVETVRKDSLVEILAKRPQYAREKRTLQDVLDWPQLYVHLMSTEDVENLLKVGADVTGEAGGFRKRSIMHAIAGRGLVELIGCFKHRVQICDNSTRIEAIARQHEKETNNPIRGSYFNCESILSAACNTKGPNFQMVETLIEVCGADVNGKGLKHLTKYHLCSDLIAGPSALHVLAEGRHWWQIGAIRYLIQKGANIEDRNERGETALHIAARGKNSDIENVVVYGDGGVENSVGYWATDCAQTLIEAGADSNATDKFNQTPLNKATRNPDTLRLLLSHGAEVTKCIHNPLFSAIEHQNLEGVKVLLDAGADIDAVDIKKTPRADLTISEQLRTTLRCASFVEISQGPPEKSAPLIKLLIERGVNTCAALKDDEIDDETLLHYVFEKGEYTVICAYLDMAAMVNFEARDQKGRTVLLAACDWTKCLPGYRWKDREDKQTAPVTRLLDLGVEILATDNDGRNALHHALNNPDLEQDTIDQLLSRDDIKPLILQRDKRGYTPLHCAFRTLRPATCERLISLGADLAEPDPTGATALHHIAAQYLRVVRPQSGVGLYSNLESDYYAGCLRLWNAHLACGGDIDARDENGDPPLFFFLRSNFQRIGERPYAKHFGELFGDADLEVRNGVGDGALHVVAGRVVISYLASIESEMELFALLMEKGLDPRAEDALGRSALDIAVMNGKKKFLELV